MDHLSHLAALCLGAEPGGLGLAGILFLAGLAGGVAHCGPMCGPFVLGQVAGHPPGPFLTRLRGAALLPFQLGRLVTYATLGAVAGAGGEAVFRVSGVRYGFAAFLALAAFLFLMQALRTMLPRLFPPARHRIGQRIAGLVVGRALRLLGRPDRARGFALGALLGFLPCGFLYGALAAAASSGSAGAGALAMVGFVLGTAPSLAAVGAVGAVAAQRWSRAGARLVGPVFLLNAIVLAAMATRSLAAIVLT